jgi:hypothetical protein
LTFAARQPGRGAPISPLSIFAVLWACQAPIHHEFYLGWLAANDPSGWLVLFAALALLVRPGSTAALAALALTSVVYNVRKWPFVVNHILVESLIDVTILVALLATLLSARNLSTPAARARAYATLAPVVRAMVVVMYAFAFLSKLNPEFFDPEVSCGAVMYDDLMRRLPFLDDGIGMRRLSIWGTLVIELALPVLLAIPRTRRYGVMLGVPFHMMLGAIGHRTFSGLACAVYSLFIMDDLVLLAGRVRDALVLRYGRERLGRVARALAVIACAGILLLVGASRLGHYRDGFGPLRVYRVPWIAWGLWTLAVGITYAAAWWNARAAPPPRAAPAPAWLHVMTALVVLNGTSQYLGLKTETCFTMYSNLRTEAEFSNHFFMPALRLAGYQDDLIEVLDTDHPALREHIERDEWITWFEFRRFTSETDADFHVVYRHGEGEPREFRRAGGVANDPELARPHPLLARKLLYFRPVSRAECAPCRH